LYFAMEIMILESITCSIFEQMVWFSHLKALIFVKLFSNNHKQFQNRVFGLKLETKGYVLHTHTHTQLGRKLQIFFQMLFMFRENKSCSCRKDCYAIKIN
jgi:hypothetical protein